MATGVAKLTCCQPHAVSDVKFACASSAPVLLYKEPMCVPLSFGEAFQKRMPVICPATSDWNFTPRLTAGSGVHGSFGVGSIFQIDTPVSGTCAGGGVGTGAGTGTGTGAGETTLMEAPDALLGIADPPAEELTALFIETITELLDGAADSCTFTVASTPSGIAFAFGPAATQMADPAVTLHVTDLPAAEAVGPCVTVAEITSEGE